MNCHASPNILDYLEDDGDDIDLIANEEAEIDHVEEKKDVFTFQLITEALFTAEAIP